ncbi:nitrogenase component 1 [Treponema endosymbiont of Eucomonympha sp.]|uniref:nitrogenase component 1 n=1 Tax=Treponema endosymbiont of Eucomonympha sp. TaxID=1580831 RepID=UPI000750E56E|nr:nitrogenase component 1 [Treponema endosymbiont of Eucomonympha sp.]
MSIYAGTSAVEVRERRLHSIISYSGTGKELYDKAKAFAFPGGERSFSQCAACPEGCASGLPARTRDTAIVFHAPIGCSNSTLIELALGIKGATLARKQEPFGVRALCTNIQERDTIFGAAEKLRNALREADKRFHPKAVYITTSCASGIIGEDVESVADEMQAELGYTVVPVYCEGFRSRIWSSGFDASFHGIIRKIVKPPVKKQEDLINVFNFAGVDTFTPLLSRLGLKTNYLVSLASLEQLETMSEAAFSTSICETLSMYVAAVLEEQYGVPEIKTAPPYGYDWTDSWLRAIGKATKREEAVEKLISEEKAKYKEEIETLRSKLAGKRVYVLAGDSFAHNLANVARSLGLVLAGVTSLHHDLTTDNPKSVNSLDALVETNGDIANFSICNMQPYQVVKILKRLRPDLLVCRHPGLTALGSKLGIPSLFEGDANYSIGYEGVVKMGRRLHEALLTKKREANIARYVELPYTDWWLRQEDPFYFFEEAEKKRA